MVSPRPSCAQTFRGFKLRRFGVGVLIGNKSMVSIPSDLQQKPHEEDKFLRHDNDRFDSENMFRAIDAVVVNPHDREECRAARHRDKQILFHHVDLIVVVLCGRRS